MHVSKLHDRRARYQESVDRAASWILSNQQEDGGFGEVESLTHYMALPASLLYLGHPDAATRLMPYLKGKYQKPNGDFDFPPPDAKPGHLAEAKYGPAWMVFSAHVTLAFDMSLPAMPYLLQYQHGNWWCIWPPRSCRRRVGNTPHYRNNGRRPGRHSDRTC